ncbi:hypothetical protein B0O99DRAFT_232772 [Bisporella sp. PMI_857]|nr:hypothetical protein B0O99DRAFT_232772 [Bisporella sp. PMI_857]
MSNSELPQHYGKKTSDSELIKRPATPPEVLSSPRRIYFPPNITYSPENAHPADIDEPHGQDYARPGLRPRPSNNTHLGRRYSDDDNERERPSFTQGNSGGSRTIGASRDDGWYRDDDRDRDHSRAPLRREEHMSHAHPDSFERSRPPRSHRNVDWEKQAPGSASKPYFDESRGEYRLDLERGKDDLDSPSKRSRHRKRSEESIDGYDYDKHNRKNIIDLKNLTKEQRAEVLRLPWTQWMNSEVKNR